MKNKIISNLFMVILTGAMSLSVPVIAYANEINGMLVDEDELVDELYGEEEVGEEELFISSTEGNFEYSLENSTITIKRYKGSESNVTIPEQITYSGVSYPVSEIGKEAFKNNESLRTVTISRKVDTIHDYAFSGCINLNKVIIRGNIKDCSGVSTDQGHDYNTPVFYNCGKNPGAIEVIFEEGVTRIPAYIFATGHEKSYNTYARVTKVTIPDTVTEIGNGAFFNCYDLNTIVWGSDNGKKTTLKTIGDGAFSSVLGIAELEIPASVQNVGSCAFANCSGLKKLTVNGKATIGHNAFENDAALEEIVLKDKTTLENCAFRSTINLKKITINGDVKDCSGVSTDQGHDYNTPVFYEAGKNSESIEVVFGEGVTRIPAYIFATGHEKQENMYAHITKVTLPVSLESIGCFCFYHCYDLKTISFAGTEARWKKLVSEIEGEADGPLKYLDDNNIKYEFGNQVNKTEGMVNITIEGIEGAVLAPGVNLPTSYEWKKNMKRIPLPTAKQISKEGYKFLGWFNKTTNKKIKAITKKDKTDIFLEARWKENTYNIVFSMSKPTGVKKATYSNKPAKFKKVQYSSEITLPADIKCETDDGKEYKLVGWMTKAGEKYETGKTYKYFGGKEKTGKTIKLYPVWN